VTPLSGPAAGHTVITIVADSPIGHYDIVAVTVGSFAAEIVSQTPDMVIIEAPTPSAVDVPLDIVVLSNSVGETTAASSYTYNTRM